MCDRELCAIASHATVTAVTTRDTIGPHTLVSAQRSCLHCTLVRTATDAVQNYTIMIKPKMNMCFRNQTVRFRNQTVLIPELDCADYQEARGTVEHSLAVCNSTVTVAATKLRF